MGNIQCSEPAISKNHAQTKAKPSKTSFVWKNQGSNWGTTLFSLEKSRFEDKTKNSYPVHRTRETEITIGKI